MPGPIVVGNWKMNTTIGEARALAQDISSGLETSSAVEVVLCPPFVSLEVVYQELGGTPIKLGAQNMHHEEKGAYTGEVSPTMLAGLCRYVILGHSERRQHFGETNEQINLKVKAALKVDLRPILCVGETYDQRQSGKAEAIVEDQVRRCLADVDDIGKVVAAYEPVWAIGTGVAATPEVAAEVMGGVIYPALKALAGPDVANQVPLLYGGSVNPENVAQFAAVSSVHGSLVGGASLRADQFLQIIKLTAEAKAN